ncbi:hypothetical protein NPIL_176791 [Nephila pilipes]|uniref:Uncharacterized protein n=1 Tax=Nephila pilipes TaxID=299642 RepID=A0A8X6UFX5_NEPPI|nr:hypothetical protein NPIL_176791 [Nephila pilipes]
MHINWLSFPTPLDHVRRRLNESRFVTEIPIPLTGYRGRDLHVLHTICMDHQFLGGRFFVTYFLERRKFIHFLGSSAKGTGGNFLLFGTKQQERKLAPLA